MLTVDRTEFMMWCEGTLLDFHMGKGVVVNEKECEEAEMALNNGEVVLLRDGARITGTELILTDEGYLERETVGK